MIDANLAEVASLGFGAGIRVVPDELKAAIILCFSLLDEICRSEILIPFG